jgi:hypothetical protein
MVDDRKQRGIAKSELDRSTSLQTVEIKSFRNNRKQLETRWVGLLIRGSQVRILPGALIKMDVLQDD